MNDIPGMSHRRRREWKTKWRATHSSRRWSKQYLWKTMVHKTIEEQNQSEISVRNERVKEKRGKREGRRKEKRKGL